MVTFRPAPALAVLVLGAALRAPAADVFVDSLGDGTGDGSSAAAPLATLRAGLDAASAGDTIWVRGGPDRSYSVTTDADTLPIGDNRAGLSIRAYGETPGDGVRASVVVANDYVESGGRAHIVSNASENVTVSGLAFSFDKRSLARQISNVNYFVAAIMNDAPSLTVDNCSFLQSRPSDGWCQSGRGGIVRCESTNLVVRNCRFENVYSLKSSGDKFTAVQFLQSATIVGSVFSNVTYAASAKENSSTVYSLVFVSNVVYGAVGGGYKSGSGFLRCNNKGAYKGEIAYNRFIRLTDGGDSHQCVFALIDRLADKGSSFHHNTIVGGDTAAFSLMSGASRHTQFFDNLILLSPEAVVLYGYKDGWEFPGGMTTPLASDACVRNNAFLAASLDGGEMTGFDGYDLDGSGAVVADNVALAEAPRFRTVADVDSENYYRYSAGAYPELARGGWTDGGKHPAFIGALPPINDGTVIVVR